MTKQNRCNGRSVLGLVVTGIFLFISGLPCWGAVKVVATTGMVADVVRQVGQERVSVRQLMGAGVDPHLYKPTSGDAEALSRADVIFYTGLMLEGRMSDLFKRLSRQGRPVYALAESKSVSRLLEPEQFAGHYDPHIWLDVSLWAETVPTVVEGLSAVDPQGRDFYQKNGGTLQQRLLELHDWALQKLAEVPEERRVLVTSHDAFNYFGRAYGFRVVGLQGISTVSEASLADVTALIDFIKEQRLPAVFLESSINPALIERVAREAGVKVGGELFSDATGAEGEIRDGHAVGTYEGMVRYNVEKIVNALR